MMSYVTIIFILIGSYYTLTFGKSLWVDDQNKLGGVGAVVISIMSIAASLFYLIKV